MTKGLIPAFITSLKVSLVSKNSIIFVHADKVCLANKTLAKGQKSEE